MTTHDSTRIDEVEEGIYRISTAAPGVPGGFSFNQYLIVDEQPLLFHSGPRAFAAGIRRAIASVLPLSRLRFIGFSHVEGDECGGLASLLEAAPHAVPVCSRVAAMVSGADVSPVPVRPLADDERLVLGRRTLRWIDTPHVPHGWDAGLMFEETTRTLLCGDLFTQPGDGADALVESDILCPSEAFRGAMDYFAHAPQTADVIGRLAALEPRTLACMHGSAWRGDGRSLLGALARVVGPPRV